MRFYASRRTRRTAEFSLRLHHLLQCGISGTAAANRERGNIILPFLRRRHRRSRRKGELFKGRSRGERGSFPKLAMEKFQIAAAEITLDGRIALRDSSH